MPTAFPLHSRYFVTLHNIHEGGDQLLDGELVNFLVQEGYVLSQGSFGWALTNKGREFIKQFGNEREFVDIIRAQWPIDLLAILRRCEFNCRPNIDENKLKDLIHTGYLNQIESGEYALTEKTKHLLIKYHE